MLILKKFKMKKLTGARGISGESDLKRKKGVIENIYVITFINEGKAYDYYRHMNVFNIKFNRNG